MGAVYGGREVPRMIPFTHPAQKIDSENKDMGDPGEGYQEPTTFSSGNSQVV